MKKRIFAVLLALCLALALVPTAAFAADEDDFTIKKGVLTEYTGSGGDVVIPESVTVIGDWAFQDCLGLTSVAFPSRLTAIGESAFSGCISLSSITLPNSVVSVGEDAFRGCTGLGSVTLSNNLKAISSAMFFDCIGLSSMTFPASVSSVGSYAFGGCAGLSQVTFLNEAPTIEEGAFANTGLVDVYYVGTQKQWENTTANIDIYLVNNERILNAKVHCNYVDPNPAPSPDPEPSTSPDPKPSPDPDPKPSPDPDPTPSPDPDPKPSENPDATGVKVTGVTLSKTSLTMEPGQSETLTAKVAPDAAENTAVTWSSNNPAVATVTSGGRVNALAAGAAEITVKTDDGGFTAVCHIIVKGEDKPGPVEVHFPRANVYNQGQFTDVPAQQWYTEGVKQAFEFGLMKGVSAKKFNPQGNVTLAEAITMAARIHSIYTTGAESFGQTNPWYQGYLDYAFQNGIISYAYYNSDVTKNATRAQFAEIFANSLPEEALAAVNDVDDGAIPDVPMTEAYAGHVYKLYRAGILAGGDARGTFSPNSYITRQECAAIVSRMAESNSRISFTLGA